MDNKKILVAYFSWSGNTENAAQYIAQKLGADQFKIESAKPRNYQQNPIHSFSIPVEGCKTISASSSKVLFRVRSYKKIPDILRNFFAMAFQGEMSAFYETDLSVGQVAFERLRAGGNERGVVFAPDCQQRRTAVAQILLKLRVKGDVALIVENQIALNFSVFGTLGVKNVERIAVGGD